MVSAGLIDFLGYFGGYMTAAASPFQLLKCIRTWSTNDISWVGLSSFVTGLTILLVYGVLAELPPVWIPITFEMSCSTSILILKIWIELVEGKEYACEMGTQISSGEGENDFQSNGATDRIIISRPYREYEAAKKSGHAPMQDKDKGGEEEGDDEDEDDDDSNDIRPLTTLKALKTI
jgi:uncharacterized protein with PQ loop repeat